MSLKYAVLAALLEGEASGYELSKVFDVSLANFWASTPQQLYRELERLAQDGLIEARVVRQERRPDKRMFTLTEAGREELRSFAATPPRRAISAPASGSWRTHGTSVGSMTGTRAARSSGVQRSTGISREVRTSSDSASNVWASLASQTTPAWTNSGPSASRSSSRQWESARRCQRG